MKLSRNWHLAYCTNIHRGETWEETFTSLRESTLSVKERVSPDAPYGIGLRLSHDAAVGLSAPAAMDQFSGWLAENDCYLFTINGFPYGKFHGTRVKEQVYAPDWSTSERLDYTKLLFDLLVKLSPEGQSCSVSTLPGSFKEFINSGEQQEQIYANLAACSQHIEELKQRTGRDIHLGLEPEPLGLFETSEETVQFFQQLDHHAAQDFLLENIGVNYDTCHLAVEYENAADALGRLNANGLRISKIHLSSALCLTPDDDSLEMLREFEEDVYLHQVIIRQEGESLHRLRDLPPALDMAEQAPHMRGDEWRVHFHVPLHASPVAPFRDTRDHIRGTLDVLRNDPGLCEHLEMETYTWEVLPEAMHAGNVVDQLEQEYRWVLGEMKARHMIE